MLNSFPAPRRGKIIRFSPLKVKILKFLAMFHTNHQKYTRRRSFLQYLNSYFLFYLGWSGSFSTKQEKYIMKVVQIWTIHLQKCNNWVCPKKSGPFHWLGAYLGPRGVTPRAIVQFLGAWEARKKKSGFSYFVLQGVQHSLQWYAAHYLQLKYWHGKNVRAWVSMVSYLKK